MPSKNDIIIRDRNFNDRTDPNQYNDNLEDDISDDIKKIYFAK
jgi:hypothetical protein